MELPQLLRWLELTDLESTSSQDLKAVLEETLEAYPESRNVSEEEEGLLELIEDELDELEPSAMRLGRWPQQYAQLLPTVLSEQDRVSLAFQTLAEKLSPEQYTTARLELFGELLDQTESLGLEATSGKLHQLEAAILQAHRDYQSTSFTSEDVTAQALVGHQFLEEGFEHWLDAFSLSLQMRLDEDWNAAVEGNRCLVAVSLWSDSLRCEPSAGIGEA